MVTLEIPAPEFVKRFQAGEIPNNAHVTVTYEPMTHSDVSVSSSEIWDDETPLSDEELEAERRLFEKFEEGVNANRRASGMRTL
ncbi:hypothetical protein EON83_07580 [bacterium]|nr:MAG: hypothetical protein EON83_07580 [bacterium]